MSMFLSTNLLQSSIFIFKNLLMKSKESNFVSFKISFDVS